MAALTIGMAGAASAQTSGGSTDGNVQVNTSIAMTGLTSSFQLTGLPGATVTGPSVVDFDVLTNSFGGYTVTVQAADDVLVGDTALNTDTIPIAALKVRETAVGDAGAWTSLSDATPVTVHSQTTRSANTGTGDSLSNDYQVTIPIVNEDNYDVTLNYVATAQ